MRVYTYGKIEPRTNFRKIPMRRWSIALVVVGAVAAIGMLALSVRPAVGQQPAGQQPAAQTSAREGQFPAYHPPRMADGHPDLNGAWQAFVSADWDLEDHEAESGPHPELNGVYGAGPAGQSIVEGGAIPYRPED